MNIKRIGHAAILNLICTPISTCHKYLIIDVVTALAHHEDWDRLNFDLLSNTHSRSIQNEHILVLRADYQ